MVESSPCASPSRLELDLGNSFLKWRCGERRGRIANGEIDPDVLAEAWSGLAPGRVLLGAVGQPAVVDTIGALCQRLWQIVPERARTQQVCGKVRNSYADPGRMGVDRWLALVAAWHRIGRGCAVVDCGSAITLDYLDHDGRHLGGYIMTGLPLMRRALLGSTAQIRVEFEPEGALAPGRSTEEAVQHGMQLMLAALADRISRDVPRLLGEDAPVLVTGGDGPRLAALLPAAKLAEDLVLDGLLPVIDGAVGCAG